MENVRIQHHQLNIFTYIKLRSSCADIMVGREERRQRRKGINALIKKQEREKREKEKKKDREKERVVW